MIIVTSGHVDHGKSALLQALTGTHTAHLPEEKKRGMTIDLGYAYLPLADKTLGFIDVPGHEKFLANMLAGLGGIDYAMLIVSADEGVQAQTLEHLAILRLLQLKQILLVISKIDRTSPEQAKQLAQQLQQDFPILAHSPVFLTSAQTGAGIEELRNYLAQLPNLASENQPFRYAIDRIFSVKGAGTVVTGTAFTGKVALEQELYFSNGNKVRVKNIHAQNQASQIGKAGQRLALNLHGDFKAEQIQRGDWLFSRPAWSATDRISIQIEAESPIKESQPVHIYHASARRVGKLNLLQHKQLAPQQQGLAELILDKPLFLAFSDKLILRSGDAKQLLAGAKVLEISSPKRHKRNQVRLDFLEFLAQSQNAEQRLPAYVQQGAVSASKLAWLEQLETEQLDSLLRQQQISRWQDWCFNADYQQQQAQKLLAVLADYHAQHGDQLGLSKARLYRMATLNQPEKLIYHLLDKLLAEGKLQQSRGWLHLPEHKIAFDQQEQQLWQQVEAQFKAHNGQSLWVRDLANALGKEEQAMRNFLYKAGKLGYLTAVVKDRFFLSEDLYAYAHWIKDFMQQQGEISVNQLRDHLQFGRKMVVQLIEYFDKCGFLRRKGNAHILRDADVFDSP